MRVAMFNTGKELFIPLASYFLFGSHMVHRQITINIRMAERKNFPTACLLQFWSAIPKRNKWN